MNRQQLQVAIVIPARYASTRLPGKALLPIAGRPMIEHVYRRACAVRGVDAVIVAVDDARVAAAVEGFGGHAIMTSSQHPSGSDRLIEVMQKIPADVYINLQGDEPLIRPSDIEQLVEVMRQKPDVRVASLCHPIDAVAAQDPNQVKVVCNALGQALYFSRSPIPYPRYGEAARYLKHVGVYAYRQDVLAGYGQLPRAMTEASESLEQLRLLEAGIPIQMIEVAPTGPGVDTAEDWQQVCQLMAENKDFSWPEIIEKSAVVRPPESGRQPEKNALLRCRLVISDVDGVLTDGGLYYDGHGEALKRFHVHDGLGIRLLQRAGIQVAWLSGRDSPALRRRAQELTIQHALWAVKDKYRACIELMDALQVHADETIYIGDDSIDLPAFAAVGFAYAVANAPDYIQAQADAVLPVAGGAGALRQVADRILQAQGLADVLTSSQDYLRHSTGDNHDTTVKD